MLLRNRALAAACLPALAAPCVMVAQDAPRGRRDQALRQEITSELRLATARGFKFLLQRQEPSGDFDTIVPVAANALVGLETPLDFGTYELVAGAPGFKGWRKTIEIKDEGKITDVKIELEPLPPP